MLEKNKKMILDILVKLKLIKKVRNKDENELNTKHFIIAIIITIILKDIVYSIGNFNFDNGRYFSVKTLYGIILFMIIYLPTLFIIKRIFLKNKKNTLNSKF